MRAKAAEPPTPRQPQRAKPSPPPPLANHPAAVTAKSAFNAQNRRLLVQHYRAKYGVK